ncbi:dihydroneopterin aldolase [Candidatus Endobugula sertula]|uniref:7,8-dihydroneopterin aldolase n=1 Tax=Candidatus Endobugula sertula TaxID=62101 RepID=A0A1D2QRU3_9GAMM|nr:dihydroneopterin aldolase [Candidatus Endobugula sertula]
MDKVIIRDLRVETIIGLYPWERISRQTLLIDMDLGTDIRQAAVDENLQYTIDYSAVCDVVTAFVQQGEFGLIETLAERVATKIQEQFVVKWLRLAIYKMDVLTHVKCVGIEIERGQDS